MKEKDIEEKIVDIINETLKEFNRKLNVDAEEKWKNKFFHSDLGLDSLAVVEIFMECEAFFDIRFNDDEIMQTKTIGDLISKVYIKSGYAKK